MKHIFSFEPDFAEVAKVVSTANSITKSVYHQIIELNYLNRFFAEST
jgi:hypothetical protein